MGSRRIAALFGAAALASVCAAPASAAKKLELSTASGTIEAGTAIDVGGASSFETPAGSVSCSAPLLTATLLSNDSAKDKITLERGSVGGANGVMCSTDTGLGSVEVELGGLPWTEQLASSGKGQLKGHKRLTVTVTVPSLFGLQCGYEAKKILQTFAVAAIGVSAPLQLAVAGQSFARSATSPSLCPASIDADFAALPIAVPGPESTLQPVLVTRKL